MSVLISGMEMPKEGTFNIVHIYDDGHVSMPFWGKGMQIVSGITAVPVTPHGDLIGREWLVDIALHLMNTAKNDDIANGVKWLLQYIIESPTIIPAEEGE